MAVLGSVQKREKAKAFSIVDEQKNLAMERQKISDTREMEW